MFLMLVAVVEKIVYFLKMTLFSPCLHVSANCSRWAQMTVNSWFLRYRKAALYFKDLLNKHRMDQVIEGDMAAWFAPVYPGRLYLLSSGEHLEFLQISVEKDVSVWDRETCFHGDTLGFSNLTL